MSCTQIFFIYIQNKIPPKRQHGKITIRSVSSEVYLGLLALLRGCSVPRKERTPHVVAAYCIRIASCAMVLNPLSGQQEDRVVVVVKLRYCYRIIVKYKFQVY